MTLPPPPAAVLRLAAEGLSFPLAGGGVFFSLLAGPADDPAGWAALASQGGFAVLAGFLGLLSYKIYQMADKVLNRALDVIEKGAATQAVLASNVGANTAEIAGLRSGIHGVRDQMVSFEARLYEQERRPAQRKDA